MDAVSDRDFVLEAVFCGLTIMLHLSRLAEEIVLWASPRFGFVSLPDAFSTGSSIMPQKRNPDVAELVRGKVGRVHGDLVALATTLKGLPLAYNRDLQEDKEPFLDADATVSSCLALTAGMVEALAFRPEAMAAALAEGYLNATELADYLAARGVPFREAHHAAGRAVARAEERGKALEELRAFSERIEDDVFAALAPEAAVARRASPGGTGPESVAAQLADMAAWLDQAAREG